jgi:transcriptional regulator GlxA family with amidase domain
VVIEAEPPYDNGRIQRAGETDQILMLLSDVRDPARRKLVLSWIRESLSRGAKILSIGSGTELLCEAGILNGKRCAVHWSDFGAAVEKYPRVVISRAFFEIDGAIITCAGELATFDAVMRLIAPELSAEIVDTVSARSLHTLPRGQAERQSIPDQVRLERLNSPLLRVVDLMEENIVEPIPVDDLFRSARISRRQAERLFEKHMGTSPKRFYLRLRLERARDLLRHTPMQVSEVAAATGFISHSHFSKTFKAVFGMLPVMIRRLPLDVQNEELRFNEGSKAPATNDNIGWSGSDRAEAFSFARRHSTQARVPL